MYWVLKDRKPVKAEMHEFSMFFADPEQRKIEIDEFGKIRVSTVFLGIDHQFGDGPPLLFETMIFGAENDEYQTRCATYEQAEEMHKKAVEYAKEKGFI